MIRNVVLVRLRNDADSAAVDQLIGDFRNLEVPEALSYTIGRDLGLRAGGWSFAIVADFDDAAGYRAYDSEAHHNELRAALAPMAEDIARVQFETP